MKMKSMVKRILAMLMAIAMFLTYTPGISYALTEEAEGGDDVVEEAVVDVTAPETETEDIVAPEAEIEDTAAPEAEIEDTAAPEAEIKESDELTEGPETSANEEVPAADVQTDPVTVEALLSGLKPAEGEADLLELEASESKAALTDAENANVVKAEDLRYFGSFRYETAIKVAERYKEVSGTKFKNVIVADGRNYPDALSGGYLAKVKHAPILLVEPSVEKMIIDYISENIASGGTVYILGGTGVVRPEFENKVNAKGIKTKRLGGKTRFDTNLAILKAAGVNTEDILVCSTFGYADSLSASAVGKPILLVGDTLTDAQKRYIRGLSTKQFYLIGGEGAVKPAILTGLKSLKNYNVQRLWGKTRYETSTAVARKFFPKTKTVMLVYALNFPDGLSGGPLAMLENAPIILTTPDNTTEAKEYVESSGAFRSITLGGTSLISVEAVRKIMGRKAPYIKADKKFANIQMGDTAVITITSNYGTKYSVKNSKYIEIVSKKTTYDEKGEPIEKYTIKGKQDGTAVLILTDKYSGLVTKSVPIIVVNGEASIETLYNIVDTLGYINQYEYDKNREDGEKTVEFSINDNKTVFFVNHSDSVELIYVNKDGDTPVFTAVKIPLDSHTIYPTIVLQQIKNSEKKANVFGTDIHPDQYTKNTELNIRNISENYIEKVHPGSKKIKEEGYVFIIKNIGDASNKDVSFVTDTFKESMAAWNSALKNNYGMNVKELGFTKY